MKSKHQRRIEGWRDRYGKLMVRVEMAYTPDTEIDLDTLMELECIGDDAKSLWQEIEDSDDCGCSDPGCPCDGEKRGPRP